MSKGDIRAGRAFVELFVKGAKLEQGLAAAARRVKGFADSLNDIGQKLATFGAAAGAGIGAAVTRFAAFDDQMRQVAAVSGASDQELQKLSETARKLGETTSFSAAEVAGLMAELGRAGFNAGQIEESTSAILDMARAAGVDAPKAAEVMGSALNQFGLGADQARRVADALALTSNISATGVEDLGEALSYSGKVAADAGMSIEDTLAILASLGNVGVKGSSAGTALQRLLTITGAEAEKLKGIFGVAFTDAAGNTRPLVDVLAEVAAATKDMPTAERTAKMAEAFGLLGITGAGAIGAAADQIRGFQEQLKNAEGSSSEAAKKMDAGLGGSFRKLRNALDAIALAIGEALAPMLSKVSTVITNVAGAIRSWISNNREAVTSITAAVAVVGGLGAALMALSTVVSAVAFAFSGLSAIVGGIISVFTLLLNPVGLAITAVGALDAGLVYASGVVPELLGALNPLVGAVKALGAALMAGDMQKAWEILATGGQYFASVMWDVFRQIPEFSGYAIGRMISMFLDAFEWIGNAASTIFSEMLSGNFDIGGILKTIAGQLQSHAEGIRAGLAGDPAPKLKTSDTTKNLAEALRKQAEPTPAAPQAASDNASAKAAMDDLFGTGDAAGGLTGGMTAAVNEAIPAATGLKGKVDELTQAFTDGKIGYDEWQDGLSNIREEALGGLSPLEAYHKKIAELQELLDAGVIDQEDFRRAAENALPDNIKSLLERAKTPLEKYNEQMTELRDAFGGGVIDQEQFSKGQDQLQKEFRDATGQKESSGGRVSVSFSALGLMAQGAGGGGHGKDLSNRMTTQISETRNVRDEVAGLREDLAKNLARFG